MNPFQSLSLLGRRCRGRHGHHGRHGRCQIGLTHARVTAGAQNLLQLDAMAGALIGIGRPFPLRPLGPLRSRPDVAEVAKILLASERGLRGNAGMTRA